MQRLGFTDWYPGNPSDSGSNEDCLEIMVGLSASPRHYWNDEDCSKKANFICEVPYVHSNTIFPYMFQKRCNMISLLFDCQIKFQNLGSIQRQAHCILWCGLLHHFFAEKFYLFYIQFALHFLGSKKSVI